MKSYRSKRNSIDVEKFQYDNKDLKAQLDKIYEKCMQKHIQLEDKKRDASGQKFTLDAWSYKKQCRASYRDVFDPMTSIAEENEENCEINNLEQR